MFTNYVQIKIDTNSSTGVDLVYMVKCHYNGLGWVSVGLVISDIGTIPVIVTYH